jgi:hypothetical protein
VHGTGAGLVHGGANFKIITMAFLTTVDAWGCMGGHGGA